MNTLTMWTNPSHRQPIRHDVAAANTNTNIETDRDRTRRSPALVEVDHYIADIYRMIGDVLVDLERFSHADLELRSPDRYIWRARDVDAWWLDRVLELTALGDQAFEVAYYLGGAGFDAGNGTRIMSGEIVFDGSEHQNFHLVLDLDAATAVHPEIDSAGVINLQSRPLVGGGREIWCDFEGVASGGRPPETSFTTYRNISETCGSLDYVVHDQGAVMTVAARWDESGGRHDQTEEYEHEDLGPVKYIATSCWDAGGADSFSAFAFIQRPPTTAIAVDDWLDAVCAVEPRESPVGSRSIEVDDCAATRVWMRESIAA
jgi:hypothetical protein